MALPQTGKHLPPRIYHQIFFPSYLPKSWLKHYHPRPSDKPHYDIKLPRSGIVIHKAGGGFYDPSDEEEIMRSYGQQTAQRGLAPYEDTEMEVDTEEAGCGGWCHSGEFLCYQACTCIPASWRCDGFFDCVGGDDEATCTASEKQKTCDETTHIRCPRTWKCISKEWLCDGEDDCGDFSDETHCV
uniref:Uncharacterized protein n=1 Tax=Rhodnius prolixus TaxID=13249 RepID=T1HYN7_RHOPR